MTGLLELYLAVPHPACQRIRSQAVIAVKLALTAHDILGKSAVWDDRRQRLVWVSFIGRRVHAYHPETGRHQLWPLPGRSTLIGLPADGGAIRGMKRDVCLWDWRGEPKPFAELEPDRPCNLLNEGGVGPDDAQTPSHQPAGRGPFRVGRRFQGPPCPSVLSNHMTLTDLRATTVSGP